MALTIDHDSKIAKSDSGLVMKVRPQLFNEPWNSRSNKPNTLHYRSNHTTNYPQLYFHFISLYIENELPRRPLH